MEQRNKIVSNSGWFATCILVWVSASHVSAQPAEDNANRAAARQLGEQGIQAFWANDFAGADEKLDKAYGLYATPTLALWSARARVKRDRWVEAAERYREATRSSEAMGDPTAQREAQRDATKELNELLPRIPSLTIQLVGAEPSEVTVTVDGVALTAAMIEARRPTNPGKHRVIAVRGDERNETELQLVEKEHKYVTFAYKPRAPSPPSPVAANAPATAPASKPETVAPALAPASVAPSPDSTSSLLVPVGIGVASLGVAALLTSGVTALVANGKLDACPNEVCRKQSDKDAYDTVKTISTATFYVGAVLAAAGVVTWQIGAHSQTGSDRIVSFEIAPTGAAMRGTF